MIMQAAILTLASDSRHPQFKVYYSPVIECDKKEECRKYRTSILRRQTHKPFHRFFFPQALQKIIADPGPATGLHQTATESENVKVGRRPFGAPQHVGWQESTGIKGGWQKLCLFFRNLF